jgi:hypothetical protein
MRFVEKRASPFDAIPSGARGRSGVEVDWTRSRLEATRRDHSGVRSGIRSRERRLSTTSLMHRNFARLFGCLSAQHTWTSSLIGATRLSHSLRLAAVMCGAVACAAPRPPARGASLGEHLELASTEAPTAGHARSSDGDSSETRFAASGGSGDDLPWLSPSHVGAAVRAHSGDFQACQALGDLESRREDGAVTVGWFVRPDGSVNDVTLGPSTFASSSINSCVLDVAKHVTFPRSAAPTNVSWTVKFRGASTATLASATLR